jgi:hypothetical protein
LQQLHEDAARGARVEEGDEVVARAAPRFSIDQLEPRGGMLLERSAEVGHPVADVMDARPSPGDEAGDGGVVACGRQELDPAGLPADELDLDPLARDDLALRYGAAEERDPEGGRGVEREHGDAHMIQGSIAHRVGRRVEHGFGV